MSNTPEKKNSDPVEDWWDPDIAALDLGWAEKNGLQVFRNYEKAFDKRKRDSLVSDFDKSDFDTSTLEQVCAFVVSNDVRLIPIVACAFIDDLLVDMYKKNLPADVPGGTMTLLDSLGPLGQLSQRIKLAYCFGWIPKHVCDELEMIRKLRNKIAHSWSVNIDADPEIGAFLRQQSDLNESVFEHFAQKDMNLDNKSKLKIKAMFTIGIALYCASTFPICIQKNVAIGDWLFRDSPPKLFSKISSICLEHSKLCVRS